MNRVEHLEHKLIRLPHGVIGCSGCSLRVERPPGVPEYTRAVMRRW